MQNLVNNLLELEQQYLKNNTILSNTISTLNDEITELKNNEQVFKKTIDDLKSINKKSSSNEMWVQLNDKNKEIEFLKKELDYYKGKNINVKKEPVLETKQVLEIKPVLEEVKPIIEEVKLVEPETILESSEPVIKKKVKKIVKKVKVKKDKVVESDSE